MPAADPAGGQQFWFEGQVWSGLLTGSTDQGGQSFWLDGTPDGDLFPAGEVVQPIQQMIVVGMIGTLGRR